MLVRALKVLGYFLMATTCTDIDTAALDQPGDEVCAYGRAGTDWQRFRQDFRRRIGRDRQWPARRQFGRWPLERDYHRRQVQRQLAGRAELVFRTGFQIVVPANAETYAVLYR
jgi:hypothetical protein